MPKTIIDLIRHGEPLGGKKYRGQTNDPLSDEGWRQMREAVGAYAGWRRIVTSPLDRCAAFAQELGRRRGIPVSVEARFKEIGFGVWEGRTPAELEAAEPGITRRFRLDPLAHRPDGAEPLADLSARVGAAWDDLLARHAGEQVLVVAHGGVIRAVLARVLGLPLAGLFRIEVHYASLSRIKIDGTGADALSTLVFHGGSPASTGGGLTVAASLKA